ncbi:aldolase/citrate lyase family protein [Paenarthrobacter sp. OM7]|uniref:HpcH/HpaI aldolase/citrate lyase family protein n=1 Tax=Paenarthrobacter sp. AMU7 TaxID=3162492 RepID=A0AB39YSH2_9MICC|nr:aldolase/citrate lyase family protein [Paenarthrobacter sp. OM7]WGM20494.1 aldolase/citrate lyase family protein [Paenarthrobacter sp. OM7]
MRTQRRALRTRVLGGERVCGVLLRMPSEELVEMLAVAGFDFIIIDCEHGPADAIPLRQHIAAAAMHGVEVLVRVGEGEDALILRALDSGAAGVVAPHVDTADQARNVVAAAHYPPRGRRGFATYGRAGSYGTVSGPDHKARLVEETLVIGMIESPLAVSAVDRILATEGLDGLMIGAADLAASSGPEDLSVSESRVRVNRALASAESLRLDLVGDAEAAAAAYADGAQMVAYNLTHALMAQFATLLNVRPLG